MKRSVVLTWGAALVVVAGLVYAADIVPNEIKQPGTQPQEIGNLESPDKCDNCHGGYNELVEPAHNWRGSMMANAGRDPIFWATLAVAEQDFDGAGDLCIRCHSTAGWLAGRSTPTDGSGLSGSDGDGVECDFCHKMTNPDDSEHLGVQFPPFVANDGGTPAKGYYGSGMASIWDGAEKLGPYVDAEARHQFLSSDFHRSVDFCGTCHDVSNPVVGDLAPKNGTQENADPVVASGVHGSDVTEKAAFNNFPFQYGIVERTFSEYKAGLISQILVSNYPSLPAELQAGALQAAYDSAMADPANSNRPDYEDGTPRYFSCQTCHLRPVTGAGCNKKGAPVRSDLPLHDMTGGNYWMPEAIKYQDTRGQLRLGGGLTATQIAALDAGVTRAKKQLNEAASVSATYSTGTSTLDVKIVNLTGHKLISGYPEGRRMWLNIRWYDGINPEPIREDGAYGPIGVSITNPFNGASVEVESLSDLHDPNTRIYEAHYGMTPDWAAHLIAELGAPIDLCLSYNRLDIDNETSCNYTLQDLADAGEPHETFHFVLNNTVVKDNRIPPYEMSYEEARRRNALPVPANQYGNPGAGGTYDYFDVAKVTPPAGWNSDTDYVEVDLKYQPTSWEYIQFLWLANNGQNAFLADEGVNLLEAWLNTPTTMAAPYVMASTTWGSAPEPQVPGIYSDDLATFLAGKRGTSTPTDASAVGLSGAQVFVEISDPNGALATTLQGFSDDAGTAVLQWKIPRRQQPGTCTATVTGIIKSGYEFDPVNGGPVTSVGFTIQ
jgi:hypothetical protein